MRRRRSAPPSLVPGEGAFPRSHGSGDHICGAFDPAGLCISTFFKKGQLAFRGPQSPQARVLAAEQLRGFLLDDRAWSRLGSRPALYDDSD